MPVRKFRDVSEMEDTLWRELGSAELLLAIARVWNFADRTCPRSFPPGVYKHRGLEEAQVLRERWDDRNFRRFWDERASS